MNTKPPFPKDEIANSITHGIGILFALIAIPFLFAKAMAIGNVSSNTLWAVGAFSFGMAMVYLSSTIYHVIQHHEAKKFLRIWDHISIFLLIGGSYTAIIQKYIDSHTAWLFLSIMWGIIAAGSILKIFFTGKYEWLSVVLYVGLGWMAVFLVRPLSHTLPLEIFLWLLAGGLAYTGGVYFFMNDRIKYNHAIWHLFVLAGTVTHFFAIYKSMSVAVNV